MREFFIRALVPCTIITFCGLCALAPLYISLGMMSRQMQHKTN